MLQFGYSCGSAVAILECAQLREARDKWDCSAWGFGFTEQGPPRSFVFHSPGCSEGAGACRGCCSCATAANHLLNPTPANNGHGFLLLPWVLWGSQAQGLQLQGCPIGEPIEGWGYSQPFRTRQFAFRDQVSLGIQQKNKLLSFHFFSPPT